MIHVQVFEHIDREVRLLREKVRREQTDPPTSNIEKLRVEEQRKQLREMESTRNKHLVAAIASRRTDDRR